MVEARDRFFDLSLEFLGRDWIFVHRGDCIVKRAGHPHNAFPGE